MESGAETFDGGLKFYTIMKEKGVYKTLILV